VPDWNPELYLKFERERTQPVRDLVARIELGDPRRILDLGCGPGNSTGVLKERWPAASVIGLDNSSAMIEKARTSGLAVEWLKADAGSDLSHLGKFDIVMANASLQWLPTHRELLPRLAQLLNSGGALAVQIPKFPDMPLARTIDEVTRLPRYAELFADFHSGMHYFGDGSYYDVLIPVCRTVELWVTHYYHVLANHPEIIEWVKSTGMRPYLDHLPENERDSFMAEVLERLKPLYPAQSDGRILFIFKRLFFIAYKPG
jgi:trans-aconitate 2-methyltransferase